MVLGKAFVSSEVEVFGQIWNSVANEGEIAELTTASSRRLYNNHRNRFWTAVRKNPNAKKLIEDMGFSFPVSPTTAPIKVLPNGRIVTITIDHITMRQINPSLALNAANLRFVFGQENSVVLRLISELDPFQAHP